ncbi:MAG: DEAD/DEAH box helicase [Clostridiales bacterium]|nr:DEAD/DEAH box helicase [Clostridiales bacterium]
MTFEQLNIIEPILRALKKEGYVKPTPIQAESIPPLLERRDLLGCAQTGTGKTCAFAVPILQHIYDEKIAAAAAPRKIRALVLTPTRELAAQNGAFFEQYGKYLGLKNAVIFGGVSQNPQLQSLKAGVDILVATPGRLIDLINQKYVSLENIGYFVLDEADRMLDMGFVHDVDRIISELPAKRQTMMFTATLPDGVNKLIDNILDNPVRVAVTPVSSAVSVIEQSVYMVNKANKTKLLIHLLDNEGISSALVFSRTKHGANKITADLTAAGISCGVIHANKAQTARQQALAKFKSGEYRVLVATDIVSRGIDILELSHVINYDLPEIPEDYVHRIGRTGRAGLGGTAISFCTEPEMRFLKEIEKLTDKNVSVVSDHPYPLVKGIDFPETRSGNKGKRDGGFSYAGRKTGKSSGKKLSIGELTGTRPFDAQRPRSKSSGRRPPDKHG